MAEQSIGALWRKEKNGNEYFTGNVEIEGIKHPIVIFANKYKDGMENRPDFKIFPSKPKEEKPPVDGSDVPF